MALSDAFVAGRPSPLSGPMLQSGAMFGEARLRVQSSPVGSRTHPRAVG